MSAGCGAGLFSRRPRLGPRARVRGRTRTSRSLRRRPQWNVAAAASSGGPCVVDAATTLSLAACLIGLPVALIGAGPTIEGMRRGDPAGAGAAGWARKRGVEQLLSGSARRRRVPLGPRGYGEFVARELHPARFRPMPPIGSPSRCARCSPRSSWSPAAARLAWRSSTSRVWSRSPRRGLAAAQAAGVEFRLVRESTGGPTLMVGPVLRG